jgi:TolB-like protein
MITAKHSASHTRSYPPRSFLGKLKKRGIFGTLAAFAASGWLIYEIVHFILVEHYHLPDRLKDIAIIGVLCALFCALTWRWFRGEKRKRKFKWEFVFIPVFVLFAAVIEVSYLLHLGERGAEPNGNLFDIPAWKNSVAILPFVNISADRDQEYFCDGLTEELITRLSQIQELKVPARTSAFVFKGENADIREVGKRLGVENVLEGSVRKSGSRVRITAQLINVADGYHLWSETYDRDLTDIFSVQDEIARSVAETLQVTLLRDKEPSSQTRDTEAYNAFLMGKYFYGQQTRESLEKAASYFEQAITLDPSYADAWAGLGATRAFQAGNGYVSPREGYDKAKAAVRKALALDKNLAYAHRVNGWIQMSCDWNWAAADASYQKAMSLQPERGQVEAAQLAVAFGRFEVASALALRAAEYDPISTQVYATLGLSCWYGGRIEEAIDAYMKILEMNPDNEAIRSVLGLVYLGQSRPLAALAELEKIKDPYWRLPGMAMFDHSQGKKAESDADLAEFIEKYQAGGAYNVAQVYAFRGESDTAFRWLERAYAQRDGGMFLVKVDPLLKNLRLDPRFKGLLNKMRLSS